MKLKLTVIFALFLFRGYSQIEFRQGGSCFPKIRSYPLDIAIDSNIDPLKVFSIFYYGNSVADSTQEISERKLLEIIRFKNLKELIIFDTRIYNLPSGFRSLDKLECLKLVNVSFTIQPKVISELSNLKRLLINSKTVNLDSIGITNLKKHLIELDYFSRNDTLEKCIGNLVNLKILDLLKSEFVKFLPTSICSLKTLQVLDLKFTSIAHLPECISTIKSLNTLDIRNTPISVFPSHLYNIPKLKILISGGCDNFRRNFSDKTIIDLINTHPESWRIVIDTH